MPGLAPASSIRNWTSALISMMEATFQLAAHQQLEAADDVELLAIGTRLPARVALESR